MSRIDEEHELEGIDGVKGRCKCGWEYVYPSCPDSMSSVPKRSSDAESWIRAMHEAHKAGIKQVEELRFNDDTTGSAGIE